MLELVCLLGRTSMGTSTMRILSTFLVCIHIVQVLVIQSMKDSHHMKGTEFCV